MFFVIIIVISRFLPHPQKQSRGNQLIYRCLTRTKSIGRGQDKGSQAGRQTVLKTDMVDDVWSCDGEGGMGKRMNQDRICYRATFSVWRERAVDSFWRLI